MGCLYKIDFPSGKSYIGITKKTAEERFEQHIREARDNPNNRQVLSALNKYGYKNCQIKTLAISDDIKYLYDIECKAIAAFNTKAPNGYNLTKGGEGVLGADSESEKIRIRKMKKTMTSPEYIDNQRKIQKSLWTKDKINKRSSEVEKLWENEEYREKVTASHIGKPTSKKQKLAVSVASKKMWKKPSFRKKFSKKMKKLWQTKAHREKVKKSKKESHYDHSLVMASLWKDEKFVKKVKDNRGKILTKSFRKKMSNKQKKVMKNKDLRDQIAFSMCKYKDNFFIKLKDSNPTRKDGLVRSTWDLLPNNFSAMDAIKLGWLGSRHFDRSLASGWIKIV